MLSEDQNAMLASAGVVPKQLHNASFAQQSPLWRKERHFSDFGGRELATMRHPYLKMGKLLGLETRRFISHHKGVLFYFEDDEPKSDYIGFCSLQDVYLQWHSIPNSRNILILSNGSESSLFYFDRSDFWKEEEQQIVKYCVQVNYSDKYSYEGELGAGSFSQVKKVSSKKNGQLMAAKVIPKSDNKPALAQKMASSQRTILTALQSQEGICTYRQFFQTQKAFIILLDYLPGQTLTTLLQQQKQLQLPTLKKIFRQMLTIIKQCHEKHIIHRDIKPQNIIISNRDHRPKLIDFGLALRTNREMEAFNYCKCGTMSYTAPQVLMTDSEFYKSYGEKCDVFSFGVVVHLLLMGYNPLAGQSETQRKSSSSVDIREEDIREQYDQDCLAFVKKLIASNPKHRYTAQEALKSAFLKEESEEGCSTQDSRHLPSTVLGSRAPLTGTCI